MAETNFLDILRRIWLAFVVLVNVLGAMGMVFCAYSSLLPTETFGYGVVAVMTFPAWMVGMAALFVLDLLFWRRTAAVAGVALLLCVPQIEQFSPVNLPRLPMSAEQQERSFTLLTYNVMHFAEAVGEPGVETNQQMNYILAAAADVVCLQEASYLQPTASNRISQEQIDEMCRLYPYIFVHEDLALMSKFPVEPLPVEFTKNRFKSGSMSAFRLHIPDPGNREVDELLADSVDILGGRIVNLFVVHLRSMAYSGDQRVMFQEATSSRRIDKDDIHEVSRELLPVLVEASKDREAQAMELLKYLAKYGGETTIVAGDFNDVTGCRAIRLLCDDAGMKTVYSQVGFGPMITFNSNHFYFHIDHVLYRGHLKPYSLRCGQLKSSDHYPVEATFTLD